jgi:methoxymalonate biosynthesis acyl carrier protein
MPSSNLIQAELTTLFAEELGLEVPSSEADLVANGLLDSLALVDLLVHLEQRYDTWISLEDLDLDNFRSIARIAQYLSNRNGSNGHAKN